MKQVSNWGNFPKVNSEVYEEQFYEPISKLIQNKETIIGRGNGRSYGDASLGKNIFSSLKLNNLIDFDKNKGILECESGVLLSDILTFVVPKKWFLFVTPGTKYITLGGAIAADVHGKNHHSEGSFCKYLLSIKLINEEGIIVDISPKENPELFWKTCGGMGQTGIIISASFRLKKIETSYISQKKVVAKNLKHALQLFDENDHYTYSVAWIDCLSKGNKKGRSIITFGEFATLSELSEKNNNNILLTHDDSKKINIPFNFPNFTLNNFTVKLFNFLYYNKEFKKVKNEIVHYETFFYPLDILSNWNRIYGKNGFYQYQFVIPLEKDNKILMKIFDKIVENGEGSFLSVLKLLGDEGDSEMGFPMKGYTLALDFKITKKIDLFLKELDQIVLEAGGRIYLIKDARMNSEIYKKMYPNRSIPSKFLSTQIERLSK